MSPLKWGHRALFERREFKARQLYYTGVGVKLAHISRNPIYVWHIPPNNFVSDNSTFVPKVGFN